MSQSAIKIMELTKSIKGNVIINNISFNIPKGSVTALLGPNGAGKSTLMKLLSGAIKPEFGTMILLGGNIKDPSIRSQVGYIPEHLEFPPRATPYNYLFQLCVLNSMNAITAQEHIHLFAHHFDFESFLNKRFSTLSAGMKQKIRIAVGFMRQHLELLLIDEPTTNLDFLARESFFKFLKQQIKETKLSILYSSHILSEVTRLAHHLLVLDQGKIVQNSSLTVDDSSSRIKSYSLVVNNIQKALQILQSHKFDAYQTSDHYLLLTLKSDQNTGDFLDLLRNHKIEIYSFSEQPFIELFTRFSNPDKLINTK